MLNLRSILKTNRDEIIANKKGGDGNKNTLNTSQNIFIDPFEKCKVYIDGEYRGETPLHLKKLPLGNFILRVESKTRVSEQNITVYPGDGKFIYKPILRELAGTVEIVTTPKNAEVFIGSKYAGRTPLIIDNLQPGNYDIHISLDGYIRYDTVLVFPENEIVKENIELKKGYLLKIEEKLPYDSIIEVSNDKTIRKYNHSERMYLEEGDWDIKISSDFLKDNTYKVNISSDKKNEMIKPDHKLGLLFFSNLKNESSIWIDGKLTSVDYAQKCIKLKPGSYEMVVKTPEYKTINKKIIIIEGGNEEVTLHYQIDMKNSYKSAGIGLMVPGILFAFPGICMFTGSLVGYYNNDFADLEKFNYDYDYYKMKKESYLSIFYAGVTLSIIGVTMIGISIPMFIIKKHNKNEKDSVIQNMSLNLTLKDRLVLDCTIKF